jgi:UDP-glucose 4-epimerase
MRVLVTGHQGLIGRAVVDRLQAGGDGVVGFDRTGGNDILDSAALLHAAEGCDAIVHLAALLGRPGESDADVMTVNVTGTWNVLAAARAAGVRRVVNFSSVNAMGIFSGNGMPDAFPIDESHACRPTTAYGISKRLGEELCRVFTLQSGISTICLRPPWVCDEARKLRELARRAADPTAEWTPFWEYGAWIDVRDLAAAVAAALTCPDPGHLVALVIGADMCSDHSPEVLARQLLPAVPVHAPLAPGGALVRSDLARRSFAWQPRHRWR